MKPTIIIPTRNRASDLKIAINSIIKQTYSDEFEVIIVDNASTDNTLQVYEEVNRGKPEHIIFKYIYENVLGLLSGRHKGALSASNEILIFIDDDIKADSNWLTSIMWAFKEKEIDMVGGPSYPMYEGVPQEWEKRLWQMSDEEKYCSYYSLIDLGDKGKYTDPNFVWGLNFSITKKALLKCGGFHPDCMPSEMQKFQGDGETGLTEKFKSLGYKAWYSPGARVGHLVSKDRLTLNYIYKRTFYQGVCDSYSLIRKMHGLTGWKLKLSHPFLIKMKVKKALKVIYPQKDKLKKAMSDGYYNGYWFHQREAAADKGLVNWIVKKDYWDYNLPTE